PARARLDPAEHGLPRPVGRRAAFGPARAERGPQMTVRGDVEHLVREARLPGAALTRDDEQRPASNAGPFERPRRGVEFAMTSDERAWHRASPGRESESRIRNRGTPASQ